MPNIAARVFFYFAATPARTRIVHARSLRYVTPVFSSSRNEIENSVSLRSFIAAIALNAAVTARRDTAVQSVASIGHNINCVVNR